MKIHLHHLRAVRFPLFPGRLKSDVFSQRILAAGLLCIGLLLPSYMAAAPDRQKVIPEHKGDELLLFDAEIHGLDVTRNYTATWREGGELTPVARLVDVGGVQFVEFSFKGERGMACSTTCFAELPPPGADMMYQGLAVTVGYDKDDFGEMGLRAHFSDGTMVLYKVALERGIEKYSLRGGYRRAKTPVDWPKLDHVMLTAEATGEGNPLTYRLQRIVMKLGVAQPKSEKQIRWEQMLHKSVRESPSMVYTDVDPKLPNVLLIGDSISMGYTLPVRKLLKGKANVIRIPANGGTTDRGLAGLDRWLGDEKWDVIHFNFGLHDCKFKNWDRSSAQKYSTPEEYGKNIEKIIARLRKTGATLIWASTTPVPEGCKTNEKGDEIAFNQVAEGLMKKYGITINDLYAYVIDDLARCQRPKNIHFSETGSRVLAGKVAETLLKELDSPNTGK